MIRDGITYEPMPNSVSLGVVTSVRTPFKKVSKLELTRELIEQIHDEAKARVASGVWIGELCFQDLGGELGTQAYAYVAFLNGSAS